MIVDYIDSHRGRFGVEPICAVLAEAGIQVAPSTYYARSKAPLTDAELDDAYLANQLRSLWHDNWGVYGARKLWHAACRAGHHIGRDQVARLMRLAGIAGTIRGKHCFRRCQGRCRARGAASPSACEALRGDPCLKPQSCGVRARALGYSLMWRRAHATRLHRYDPAFSHLVVADWTGSGI